MAVVITPYYLKPAQEELAEHYIEVCRAVRIPVLAYNFPRSTDGVRSAAGNSGPHRRAQCENIAGVKDSGGQSRTGSCVPERGARRIATLAVFVGPERMLLPALQQGCAGAVSGVSQFCAAEVLVDALPRFRAEDREECEAPANPEQSTLDDGLRTAHLSEHDPNGGHADARPARRSLPATGRRGPLPPSEQPWQRARRLGRAPRAGTWPKGQHQRLTRSVGQNARIRHQERIPRASCIQTDSPTKRALTCCSTRTIRWTGIRGDEEAFEKAARARTSRSFSRSATPPATGATSWSANRSRASDRGAAQPRFRADQGGSRRAARRGPHLHDLRAGHHRRRRLADVGLADARAASRSSAARISRRRTATAVPGFASILTQIAEAWQQRPRADRRIGARSHRAVAASRPRSTPGRSRPDRHGRAGQRLFSIPPHLRFATGRVRRRSQISASDRSTIFCCATTRARRTRKRSTWCC